LAGGGVPDGRKRPGRECCRDPCTDGDKKTGAKEKQKPSGDDPRPDAGKIASPAGGSLKPQIFAFTAVYVCGRAIIQTAQKKRRDGCKNAFIITVFFSHVVLVMPGA
jgi:hypothetical protein